MPDVVRSLRQRSPTLSLKKSWPATSVSGVGLATSCTRKGATRPDRQSRDYRNQHRDAHHGTYLQSSRPETPSSLTK